MLDELLDKSEEFKQNLIAKENEIENANQLITSKDEIIDKLM